MQSLLPKETLLRTYLTVVQQAQARAIISDYSNTFTTRPGCTMLIEHDIKLTTDTPVRVKQYALPFSTMETIKGEINEMIGLSPPVKYFTDRSKAVLLLWIFYVFVLSCVCYVFVRICLYVLCGHLLGKG